MDPRILKETHYHSARRQTSCEVLLFARMVIAVVLRLMLAAYLFIIPESAWAQMSGEKFEDVFKRSDLPWRLNADEIRYDQIADVYVAQGNVEITKADKTLTADYVRFDHKTMWAYAQGNVMLISGQDVLKGSRMEIDLENQVGTVENGSIFLKENNFHIEGDEIRKTGEATYELKNATITTCDGDTPDWKITGRDVKVEVEGYGSLKHATVWARDYPVMYTPYFWYPAKSKRQTGLLIPEFGYSDRKGAALNQPFFWAISDSQDATFYLDLMNFRGIKPGLEYRYILNETTNGAIMLDGFHDDKVDDGTERYRDRYGFDDPGTQLLRTNRDRWWFRMSHHQSIPWDFFAKLDLDFVSDQDYLREFDDGYMGFKNTRDYYSEFFGRDLDDYNDPIRLNRLNFNRIWPRWSLNAELRYFWDATQRNSDLPDTTLSRLPVIDLQASKQRILTSPLYFDLDSQYDYFWRESGSRGQRIDAHPRIYWPYRFKTYFTFEPSLGLRETFYYLDESEFSNESDPDREAHRELYDLRIELFSEVYRIFNVDKANISKIQHSIRPKIVYDYIPDEDQEDLPNFDVRDRIKEKNLLTYSLTNTLTSKLIKGVREQLPQKEDVSRGDILQDPTKFNYKDFLRLKLEQSYDLNKSQREFSPLFARLDFFPGSYISIDADAGWSFYDNRFVSRNIAAKLRDNRGDSFYVDYRYDRGETDDDPGDDNIVESIFFDVNLNVMKRLLVFGDYERNIEEDLHIRTSLGFTYTSQCWSFDFRYTNKPNDEKYEFKINLHGLGGIGF
ncbi:MAG: LPS-assembly protein LptD [Desulfobacterales bacterium]|nr:MAG: LPS-assembly protein LptD [Desulfobacterales bacterium]